MKNNTLSQTISLAFVSVILLTSFLSFSVVLHSFIDFLTRFIGLELKWNHAL